jgi:hypothetical protein
MTSGETRPPTDAWDDSWRVSKPHDTVADLPPKADLQPREHAPGGSIWGGKPGEWD